MIPGIFTVDCKTHLSIIELMGSNLIRGICLGVHFILLLGAYKMTLMDAVFYSASSSLISGLRGPEVSLPSKC